MLASLAGLGSELDDLRQALHTLLTDTTQPHALPTVLASAKRPIEALAPPPPRHPWQRRWTIWSRASNRRSPVRVAQRDRRCNTSMRFLLTTAAVSRVL